jgi:uncharacterized RDD family membrane protein YckC
MDHREEPEFNPYAAPRVYDSEYVPAEPELFRVHDVAGFWHRFAAWLLDIILIGFVRVFAIVMLAAAGVKIVLPNFTMDPRQPPTLDEAIHQIMFALVDGGIMAIVHIAYFTSMESSRWQGTFGKMAVGIKVTTLEGRRISVPTALGRNVSKLLSGLICYIGYIMAAFTARKQALHDLLASTIVVRR